MKSKRGPKNSKLYNAHALMMSIYCGNQRAIWWQQDDEFWRGEWEEEKKNQRLAG